MPPRARAAGWTVTRARVTHGGFAVRGADTVWNGTGLNTSGSVTADQAMSIAFKFASIPAGGTVSFLYAINLEPSASDALACLDDTDSDGVLDPNDPQPTNPGICGDSDADSCDDCSESTYNPAADGTDSDSDGQCDAGDADDDNDQAADGDDAFPLDPDESVDTDGDGQGHNADADDDADGVKDSLEARLGTAPLDGKTRVQLSGGGCNSTGSPSATWSLFLTVVGLSWHSRRRHTSQLASPSGLARTTT